MNKDEKIAFIANVIAVARADGKLMDQEKQAISRIAAQNQIFQKEVDQGRLLSKSPDFVPEPTGRFSDRIRNLEDMAYVAMSDRDFDPSEKEMVKLFAKRIELSQEQLSIILDQSVARYKQRKLMEVC
ncbi:MAG: TerB family tellurite resistance protein [Planctomycetes bacterium]|nr:TerB family tellurite resistance protein [Planctomycetota bacterium]